MTTKLKIGGMSCGHCSKAVERAVSALPGVEKVAVSLADGAAEIEHDPAKTPIDKIINIIENEGYSVL